MDLLISDFRGRLQDRRISISLTDAAKDYLIDTGFDPVYGARPLKRLLQSKVETLVARYLIANDPEPDTVLTIDRNGDDIIIKE